jgi:uncharacterized RDD family membrane protein YckC
MNDAIWYYLDNTGTQVGPVSAESLRGALRLHTTAPGNLAWREGLPGWTPIASLAAELGVSPAPGTPPPPTAYNPYESPRHAGPAPAAGNEVVHAGFVRRWAALFLDQLVLSVPLAVVFIALGMADAAGSGDLSRLAMLQASAYVLYFIAAPLYYALQESSAMQATLGKRALGIKVTDLSGQRLSFGHALGRWFAAALSYLTLYIGFLMAAFTERKQALHDMVASTLVVDKWAFTAHPERQKRGLSGCLVVFLIAMLMVPIIAILAAISISQYQDYVIRSQVSEGSSLADGVKTAVGEYINNRGEWPGSNANAGLAEPSSIAGEYVGYVDIGGQPGVIEVGYSSDAPQHANAALDGKHLLFVGKVEGNQLVWSCTSEDLKQKWCPSSCECRG